jgi:hypothetical protein
MKFKLILLMAAGCLAASAAAFAQYGYSDNSCEDARDRARSAASDLSAYARRLQSCANNEDFSDDCSTEFRRVRYAHSDYESSISDVSVYCD